MSRQRESARAIEQSNTAQALRTVAICDAFSNPGARTGVGQANLINSTQYPITRLTQDWQVLTSLYRNSWIVQRVCNIIPNDALTDLWIDCPGLDDMQSARLSDDLRRTHTRERMIEALRWARLYGGAAAIVMIDNIGDDDLSAPLQIDEIPPGGYRGLYVVDRWSGIYPDAELIDNINSADYGLPRYYNVRDAEGLIRYRVHHSRVLRYIGADLPYDERIAEQYWGASIIETMYDDLVRHDNISHNIANLTFRANLAVQKCDGFHSILQTNSTEQMRRIYDSIQAASILESNLGCRVIDSTDSIQHEQYNFSGLPEVLDGAMLDISGATSIPATRLFGRSPAGLNSTGEGDEKIYNSVLQQVRAAQIQPALDKLLPIICMSALGHVPAQVTFCMPPLGESTAMEKMDVIDRRAQLLERLFSVGAIPADVLLDGVRAAEGNANIASVITDDNIEAVKGKYQRDLMPQGGDMLDYGLGGDVDDASIDEIEPEDDEPGGGADEDI